MQRRDFFKAGMIGLGATTLVSDGKAEQVGKESKGEFTQVFKEYYVPENQQFYLDLPRFPYGKSTIFSRSIIQKTEGGDYLLPQFYKSDDINLDCAKILIASVVVNKPLFTPEYILVTDGKTYNQTVTDWCLDHLSLHRYVQNGYITDLYHGPSTVVEYSDKHSHVIKHCINKKEWDKVRNFYLNDLKQKDKFNQTGKKDLVIAVNRNVNNFIIAYRKNEVAISVLKNHCITLGAV